ncbi:ABC transporter permease [Streptomyces albus]|uniref:ABC transporter permease n=1 Tax=Streptomyces albus TaxID=1888 RepID=UPI000690C445|nr:ABC transporter permease [Streptomyces albus]
MTRPARDGRTPRLRPSRLSPADIWQLSLIGVRARPLRAVLSASGIAIGIAAMVAVMGISTSSHAELDRTLDRLGTNLLRVSAGRTVSGEEAALPPEAVPMVRRLRPVTRVSATGAVDARVYRSDLIPEGETNALEVVAARTDLLRTLGGTTASGSWLNRATARYPAVVLGSVTARRLGIARADPDLRIRIGDEWFTVTGVLDPVVLAPELDRAALVGYEAAEDRLGFDGGSTLLYVRAEESAVTAVRGVLARTVNPPRPETVEVSRPSEALAARAAADRAFTGLLLGIGAVALLVGGIGVANTMVISVLERRGEIGLRRALGATRGQIRTQFLAESLVLAGLGGVGGAVLGGLITGGYAANRGWPVALPAEVLAAGVAGTLLIGALAGLYPAVRAARVAPAGALATG